MLDGLAAFKRRTEDLVSGAQRIPAEIQDTYNLHAARLRETMDAIDQALTASNLTEDDKTSANALRSQLESAATALYAKGRTTRIDMIKQQLPKAARVEWLHSVGEVEMSKTAPRRRLQGHRDYLDEYEVHERGTGKLLWYAHFHYANATAPVASFTAAHMKTIEQRLLGGAFDLRDSSNKQLIAIYRSEISPALANSLFFS
ncbi:hypothetical protein D3C76_1144650 [compost metagenome]